MSDAKGVKDAADYGVPSCESCRKRKLKCGRQQPTCTNCHSYQVSCIYDFEKKKPGLKIGAVESLSKRLEVVEAAISRRHADSLLTNTQLREDTVEDAHQSALDSNNHIIALTKELGNLTKAITAQYSPQVHGTSFDRTPGLTEILRKRKRTRDDQDLVSVKPNPDTSTTYIVKSFGDSPITGDVLHAFSRQVQPWLSILHEPSIRDQLRQRKWPNAIDPVFEAMVVASLRHIKSDEKTRMEAINWEGNAEGIRQHVMCEGLETPSIETIQALLVLTYTDVLDGHIQRATSLLGIIARHSEILGLHQTWSDDNRNIHRVVSHHAVIHPDWVSEEEAKRVFWNMYILNRLCAVLTGCNLDDQVLSFPCRLPACASFWYTNRKVETPFLQKNDPSDSTLDFRADTLSSHATSQSSAWKGSLAFFIETVALMSTILPYVRRNVNHEDHGDIARWLGEIRSLDQQLMQ